MQTPSPAGPSQTFKAAACQSPRPAKAVWTPDPSSTCWPWIINDGLSASHSPSKEVPVSSSIRASHSQSDIRYRKFSRNHQCTCMSLTFLAYQNEGCQLNSAALDRVLAKGDSLYVGVKRQLIRKKKFHSDHLTVEELPKQVLTDTDMFHFHWPEIRCGPVKASGSQAWGLPLATQLECLSGEVNLALIIVSPECIAVFRDQSGRYGVFDSHSRNAVGLPHPHGTAIMKTFLEISDLADHLHKLFANRAPSASYEFVPVSFEAIGSREHLQASLAHGVSRTALPPAAEPVLKTAPAPRPAEPVLKTAPAPRPAEPVLKSAPAPRPAEPVLKTAPAPRPAEPVLKTSPAPRPAEPVLKTAPAPRPAEPVLKTAPAPRPAEPVLKTAPAPRPAEPVLKTAPAPRPAEPVLKTAPAPCPAGPVLKTALKPAKEHFTKLPKQQRRRAMRRASKNQRTVLSGEEKRKKTQYEWKKYSSCPEFRRKRIQAQRRRYVQNSLHQKRRSFRCYHENVQDKKKEELARRYRKDATFRQQRKTYITKKYKEDATFRTRQKEHITDRYKSNAVFRSRQKFVMSQRYNTDPNYSQKQKQDFNLRYHNDTEFKRCFNQRCNQQRATKLATNAAFSIFYKMQRALRLKRKYRQIVPHRPQPLINPLMEVAIAAFRESIRHGPTYICTVCHRAQFPNQVKECKRQKYSKHAKVAAACLTGKYVHFCDSDCSTPCSVPQERLHEWICYTCDSHLIRGRIPPMAVINNLELAPIPPKLSVLNMLERQLIAKILPFAKIVALPKGQQRAVHGAVVCVPSEMEATVNSLPRPRAEAQLLQVKLKRHIKYKGYQHFYTVNMKNVLAGLATLKEMHSEYKDVFIDETATFDCLLEEEDPIEEEESRQEEEPIDDEDPSIPEEDRDVDLEDIFKSQNEPGQLEADEEEQEELRPGLSLDTCMQPPDIAQEILSYGDGIFSVAPAQGNKPVGFFTIPKLEAMAFPVQFPTGENTLAEARTVSLSPSLYFNSRLFAADTRFASDQSYLFFAQFVTETHLATNSMSIQMRKGKSKTKDGRRINNVMLQDKDEVERLIMSQDATRFMQPLRGTPAYWNKTLKDVHAMVRQIGKPTFFATFSAAEMRWPEFIEVIKAQQGEQGLFSDLDWKTKCDILRSNPVTVMRMFEKRVEALMTNLILSPARPIGEVEDYFYRVEFQARGSPHIHMLIWIKDSPKFEEDPDSHIMEFIDKYISCKMPDPDTDPELHKIVSEVQVHSRKHSKSCKKGNVACRFGFPKLPMDKTFITRPPTINYHQKEDQDDADFEAQIAEQKKALAENQKLAKRTLQPVRDLLMDSGASFSSLTDLLCQCNLTYEQYFSAAQRLANNHVVMLKRHPNDCWVNAYNPDLLRAWNANMDIQYVIDDYSCIMYMMSYVAKPEHEMTEFLKNVIKDVKKSDVNKRDEMKQIMQAYSKHREVSAQEAVARTCSLRLKKCSRSVVFIQTDEEGLKMSHPMSRLVGMEPGSEDVWMSGLPEKYVNRPLTREFERMCLAEFASDYRVLYGQQTESPNAILLLNDQGFIQKRTVGKPAIIRFTRFSEEKTPEKFYRRLLKLYLPHRSDADLRDEAHPTYEEFYRCSEKWGTRVELIVGHNKKRYEGQGKTMEAAFQQLQVCGPLVNAWNSFAPEIEVDRLECLAECEPRDEDQNGEDVPEFGTKKDKGSSMPRIEAPELSPDFVRKMYQSLNETQASVFYSVRQWCFELVWGHNPEPFYYFLSGGAGCGKSHVIKCIHHEATRILRELPRFRDHADMSQPAVLLTAFTGTAAFNISGNTLHSILKLPRSLKPPYQGLGNALDEVRATLANAEILIIDEISMVSKELFAYVHWRFQQIRGNRKPFGGMSVLAVGDFYQLPPLGKAKPLCVYEETEFDLWKDNFKMVTLTEIMRQKDDRAFAELLNRLRVKQKEDPLLDEDRLLLTQAVADGQHCPALTLHIYATNKEVDRHNADIVTASYNDAISIAARDFRKDPRTGCMTFVSGEIKGHKRDLPDNIMAAQGVRVMLIRNLDVEDGLVNGTFGTISNIVIREPGGVKMIGLLLDNPTAGQRFRKKILGPSDNSVYIERSEENLSNKKGVVRRQFPMKLAFACTAHKVQGMTMPSAVVCLKRIFESGMAYVALSRTTSLQGLTILDFDEKKIYADPKIKTALESMPHASFQSCRPLLTLLKSVQENPKVLTIVHHNTQGLPCHMVDLKAHHELQRADVLCLTETHLSGSSVAEIFQLEGYTMFTRSRQLSYNSCVNMAKKEGGGVAMYCRDTVQAEPRRYMQQVTDLEFVVLKIEAPVKVLIATVYKPPSFQLGIFLQNLKNLLDSLDMINHQPIIVCGDFNEDLLSKGKKSIKDLFQSRGYTQLVANSTTEKNTLIDHIYISHPDKCLQSGVLQTYYSYHSPVYCILTD
uniref:ATP-dependent DNA helicase n=2 Tax=Sparus aurata TaxID=8175 RepID=A0A671TM37_SPAAU